MLAEGDREWCGGSSTGLVRRAVVRTERLMVVGYATALGYVAERREEMGEELHVQKSTKKCSCNLCGRGAVA